MNKYIALRVLAVIAFVCAIVGTIATEADAKTVGSQCRYEGVINGYGTAGKRLDLEFGLYFHEWECTIDGNRVMISNANTWRETEVLQETITYERYFAKKVRTGSIWCGGRGDNSYMIYAAYRVHTWKVTEAEVDRYNLWKARYADKHGCLVS